MISAPIRVLRIGDRCVIGRGSHIVAHHSIEIGDDVFTGPYVYITDQNHSYADPDVPVGRQWPVNSSVRIGAGTWLGTGAVDPAGRGHRQERGRGRRRGRPRQGARPRGSRRRPGQGHPRVRARQRLVGARLGPRQRGDRVGWLASREPASCGTNVSPRRARLTSSAALAVATRRRPSAW